MSNVISGLPSGLTATVRKLGDQLLGGGWLVRHQTVPVSFPDEYYTDPARATEIKTPARDEVWTNIGFWHTGLLATVDLFFSKKQDSTMRLDAAILRQNNEPVVFVKTLKGVTEWVNSISSELTPETVQESLF